MKTILLIFSFSSLLLFSHGQTANITLKVTNIKEVKGNINFAIFKSADGFPNGDQYFLAKSIPVDKKEFTYIIKDVSTDIYAISVYQDYDEDGVLNNNMFGIPKEPYGFSNDARGKKGPPKFEDAVFQLKYDMETSIKLIH